MNLLNATLEFFARYRSKDIEGMVKLFTNGGTIDYIPVALKGSASQAGRGVWGGLLDAFPDLTNEVTATYLSQDGRTVTAEVLISGTQAKEALGIENRKRSFSVPHLFLVHGNEAGEIEIMRAYWDNATLFTSLGKTTLP